MPTNDDVQLQFTKADSDRLLKIEMKLDTALLQLAAIEVLRGRVEGLERDRAKFLGMLVVWTPICTAAGLAIEKFLLRP